MLVGLPGCGKTTLGNHLTENDLNSIFIDDISICGINELKKAIELHSPLIVVADVYMCRTLDRGKAKQWLKDNAEMYEVEWVFFENAPDKCLKNVRKRNDGRTVEGLIADLTKIYVIPDNALVRKIYDPSRKRAIP